MPVMILANLEGRYPVDRKPVVAKRLVIGCLKIEHRKAVRPEQIWLVGPGPELDLPLGNGKRLKLRPQISGPRSSGDHQATRFVARGCGADGNAFQGLLPADHLFLGTNYRSRVSGCLYIVNDAAFRQEKPA